MRNDARPRRIEKLAWRRLGEQLVILELGSQRLFHELNDVGASIWDLSDGKRTVAEIADSLAADFDVSPDAARDDTLEFLNELSGKGLLEWS